MRRRGYARTTCEQTSQYRFGPLDHRLGDSSESAWLGSTPRTKQVSGAARREALRLGHGRGIAAPVHVLLALSAREDGVAAQIFRALDVNDDQARAQLHGRLAGETPRARRADTAAASAPSAHLTRHQFVEKDTVLTPSNFRRGL